MNDPLRALPRLRPLALGVGLTLAVLVSSPVQAGGLFGGRRDRVEIPPAPPRVAYRPVYDPNGGRPLFVGGYAGRYYPPLFGRRYEQTSTVVVPIPSSRSRLIPRFPVR